MCLGVQYRKMFYILFEKSVLLMEYTHIFFLFSGQITKVRVPTTSTPHLKTIFFSLENSLKWIENEFSSLNLDWRINFFKSFFQNIFQLFDFV